MNMHDIRRVREMMDPKIDGLFAIYRGIVVSKDDPDRLGRCKVRVWHVHGSDQYTPDFALPWAEVLERGDGAYDSGTYEPPCVGSSVWCQFENGYADYPVVIGVSRGVLVRDDDNPHVFLTRNGEPKNEKPWLPAENETETPKEVYENRYSGDPHSNVRVWHKSYKGHTIYIEDEDGSEFLRIIDRSGQLIEMYCPVDEATQAGNTAQRGLRSVITGDQLSHDAMKYRSARIRLVDLSGQEVVLNSTDLSEEVLIKGKCRQTGKEQIIRVKSGPGKESIELADYSGNRLMIDANSFTPIRLEDNGGNSIIFDKQNGTVTVRGAKGTVDAVKTKSVETDGTYSENIGGEKNVKVSGNVNTDVAGDVNIGAAGLVNLSFGSALGIVITNMPMDGGLPATRAVDIAVANGGFRIRCLSATGPSNIDFYTLMGNASLDGVNVRLGGPLSTEPLVCGNLWRTMMSTLLGLIAAHVHLTGVGPSAPPTDAAAYAAMQGTVNAGAQLSNFVFTEKVRSVLP
jgi:hypothetical protein